MGIFIGSDQVTYVRSILQQGKFPAVSEFQRNGRNLLAAAGDSFKLPPTTRSSMTYAAFSRLLAAADAPCVLLEGTRAVSALQAPYLTALAEHLARAFPNARFRTGNAKGSDEAFAEGVARVDASRLEFVLPYASHRSGKRPPVSSATAIDDISAERVRDVVAATLEASPQYERVAVNYGESGMHPRQRATAQLILRDTLKVTGTDSMTAPVAGIFYVNAANPDSGGTGHTMRVCRSLGVPVVSQFHWLEWPF